MSVQVSEKGSWTPNFSFFVQIELNHLDLVRRVARDHPYVGIKSGLKRNEMSQKQGQETHVNGICAQPVPFTAFTKNEEAAGRDCL